MNDLGALSLWPEGGLERVVRCPICGGETRSLLHDGLRDRIFFCAPGEWSLYRCQACGSAYLDPRPTAGTIGLAYKRYFTHAENRPKTQELSCFRHVRVALANGYRNARFGLSRRPSLRIGAWVAYLRPWHRANLQAEARHLSLAKAGATLLDVGCGDGTFLEFAAEMGWKVEGVEPDPEAADAARNRGLLVHQGSIECLADRGESFDMITMSHVIEHVHDPRSVLTACLRLLKKGGLIWLETPNLEAAGHVRYGRDWRDLDSPRHLVLFTWESLRSLLREVGFATVMPLRRHGVAALTFPASEAIKKGRDPIGAADKSFGIRLQAWRADAWSGSTACEFITIAARKPAD